jgi:hypothetical protein
VQQVATISTTVFKREAIFLLAVGTLAMSLALILVLQQQLRFWWVALIAAISGFFVVWWIVQNTSSNM